MDGGIGIFGFAVTVNFSISFSAFVPKNFGFSVLVTIAVSSFCSISLSVFGFWQKQNCVFDLLFDAVWCFSKFSAENMRLTISTTCTSSLILLPVFDFYRNLFRFCVFLLLFVRFCGFLYTLMPHSSWEHKPTLQWESCIACVSLLNFKNWKKITSS